MQSSLWACYSDLGWCFVLHIHMNCKRNELLKCPSSNYFSSPEYWPLCKHTLCGDLAPYHTRYFIRHWESQEEKQECESLCNQYFFISCLNSFSHSAGKLFFSHEKLLNYFLFQRSFHLTQKNWLSKFLVKERFSPLRLKRTVFFCISLITISQKDCMKSFSLMTIGQEDYLLNYN